MSKPLILIIGAAVLFASFFLGANYSPSFQMKPDFSAIKSSSTRQKAFIGFLVPKINYANSEILETRAQIETLISNYKHTKSISVASRIWLHEIADVYAVVPFSLKNTRSVKKLLRRVDIVPPSLVLAQAANESGWGTSRFAVKADNFFGQHCHVKGCGLVPHKREKGTTFEVQKFPNVQSSVNQYLYNLNTNNAYTNLRVMRAELRRNDKPLVGIRLVPFLANYSILGEEYSLRISSIIVNHDLMQYDALEDTAMD